MKSSMSELTPLKVGYTFRDYQNTLCHVRGLVDNQIVYRYWRKSKQRWQYMTEGSFGINLMRKHLSEESNLCKEDDIYDYEQ